MCSQLSRFKSTLVDKPLTMNLKHILIASLNLKAIITAEDQVGYFVESMFNNCTCWLIL